MLHTRCNEMIHFLKQQLADEKAARELDKKEAREREDKWVTAIASRPQPQYIPIPAPRPPVAGSGVDITEDLPPEFFDPEDALFLGDEVVPKGWTPPNGKSRPRAKTAAGQILQAKADAAGKGPSES